MIAAVPKVGGKYDLKALSELALSLKRDHPDVDDASVLLEPEIAYDDLIQVMDAIRSVEKPAVAAIGEQDQEPFVHGRRSAGRSAAREGGALYRHRSGRRAMTVFTFDAAPVAHAAVITGGMLI